MSRRCGRSSGAMETACCPLLGGWNPGVRRLLGQPWSPYWVEGCGESLELGGPSLLRARPLTQVQAWGQRPQLATGLSLRLVLEAL